MIQRIGKLGRPLTHRRVNSKRYRQLASITPDTPCALCGWSIPLLLRRDPERSGVQAHHITHVAAGGSERDPDNIVALCPNHHALAHVVFPRREGAVYGPASKAEFLERLRMAEHDAAVDPAGYQLRLARAATSLLRREKALPEDPDVEGG